MNIQISYTQELPPFKKLKELQADTGSQRFPLQLILPKSYQENPSS